MFIKFTVTPVLVALMSLAARRFGPAFGGIIMGLPWMTGPILFFLGLERGNAYLEDTARGVLLGVPGIAAYALTYAMVARHAGWPASLLAGATAFGMTGWLLLGLTVSATVLTLLAAAALIAAKVSIPPPRASLGAMALPWWDIPARMVATAGLIGCMTVAANYVGPTALGIVSTFPVIMTVITTFSHHRWGADAAMAMLRGIMLSLIGFSLFFWVLALFGQQLGLVPSFTVATLVGVGFSVALLIYNRWLMRAPS